MIAEGGCSPEERIVFAFRRAMARTPTPGRARPSCGAGSSGTASLSRRPRGGAATDPPRREPAGPELDPVELAAYTATAGVILNLDETITPSDDYEPRDRQP